MGTKTRESKDYERRLRIEPSNLSEELIEQPELYYHVAMGSAYAVSVRDQAKDQLKTAIAERGIRIRAEYQGKGEKLTEAQLASLVESDPIVITCKGELRKLQLSMDKWQAMKEAFQQRSYMLKDLCALQLAREYESSTVKREEVLNKQRRAKIRGRI
jgi:hypothetical protein